MIPDLTPVPRNIIAHSYTSQYEYARNLFKGEANSQGK
jgi:hypothetical protein